MSNCCNTSEKPHHHQDKHTCPVNGHRYNDVSVTTIKHHIQNPWNWQFTNQAYYFCDDSDCEVVYYGEDDSIIERSSLRTRIGVKEHSEDALICYCFGVTRNASTDNPEAKAFVIDQTRNHNCSCSTRNPLWQVLLKRFSTLMK